MQTEVALCCLIPVAGGNKIWGEFLQIPVTFTATSYSGLRKSGSAIIGTRYRVRIGCTQNFLIGFAQTSSVASEAGYVKVLFALYQSTLEALRNVLYKCFTYLLTYLQARGSNSP